ncbi:DUF4157 domain-containing protein [Enterovibrio sp. ZSDZ42]|uniref:DUF4157 domain-containing protein n=1 Tax=Enterovibrio gelatinilyticus TaxID=2899819 RepID=A0ABT5R5G4_9GAMM|nr:DUF4157 domain-containing protein [Enterovibrio sp. ZSDZ42]MDD1795519.1 DUF4157 domain-containing protein [Enterovibrio sp. ZSDZ42]
MFSFQPSHINSDLHHGASSPLTGFPAIARPMPVTARPMPLQAKLTMGSSHDVFEQEADRVADQVVSMPMSAIQGACSCGGVCSACKSASGSRELGVQRKAQNTPVLSSPPMPQSSSRQTSSVPLAVHQTLRKPGELLDNQTRSFMEPRFGADFSQVRIHTDNDAAKSARSIHARAYTVGSQVVFGTGQYRPQTDAGRRLIAHELTHVIQQQSNSGSGVIQRAETDTAGNCASLKDCESDIDKKVNTSLTNARKLAGKPPKASIVVKGLANDLAVNQSVGRSAIEVWADTLPSSKISLPAQSSTKYKGVGYGIWANPLFPILNPTMKVHGICIGSDKLGHFFQQGLTYFQTEATKSTAAAEEESERTEGGGFGIETTGVYSNADQEANRTGGKFYKDLVANPSLSFAISNYINSNWNEETNPNFYEKSVGGQVWSNLLKGSWSGTSLTLFPVSHDTVFIDLGATSGGKIKGTIQGGVGPVMNSGTITGTITMNTKKVRGQKVWGSKTTPTAVTGIELHFDWKMGSESGKGMLASSDEQTLVGTWGNGTSTVDRGMLRFTK